MHLALACALLAAPPALVDVTRAMDIATLPSVAPPLRPAAPPALTVSLVDVEGLLSDEGVVLLTAEVRGVFREIGVNARVVRAAPGRPIEEGEGVVVPVIARRRQPPNLGPDRIMGLVLRDHAAPSPVWVFVDNVRSTLRTREGIATDARELGVAVGRVVAHEVIHALAPRHPHALTGLMAPVLDRVGLLGPRLAPEESCARSALAGLAAILGTPRPPVDPAAGRAHTALR
jgi:hypothetical protein